MAHGSVSPGVTHRVHWMPATLVIVLPLCTLRHNSRCHLIHPIESKVLVDEKERIAPIPSEVFDDAMCVELDKHIEDKEYYTCRPAQRKEQPSLWWTIEAGNSEEAVRDEVTHQDQVYYTPEDEPCVVLERRFIELVVLRNLGLHLALDELVQGGMWILASLGLFKYVRVLCPQYKAVVLRLPFEKPSDACIVGSSPEEEDGSEDGYSGALGQDVEREYQAGEHSKDGKIGEVLWLRGREKLRDHVVSLWHNKHYARKVSTEVSLDVEPSLLFVLTGSHCVPTYPCHLEYDRTSCVSLHLCYLLLFDLARELFALHPLNYEDVTASQTVVHAVGCRQPSARLAWSQTWRKGIDSQDGIDVERNRWRGRLPEIWCSLGLVRAGTLCTHLCKALWDTVEAVEVVHDAPGAELARYFVVLGDDCSVLQATSMCVEC